MQSLAAMLDTGHENVHRKRVQSYKGGGGCDYSARKTSISLRKLRETHFCDWSPQHESRFLCFFESEHCSLLERNSQAPRTALLTAGENEETEHGA